MLKKINNVKVKLPDNVNCNFDVKKVKGKELFEEPYANIYICAKKKSGKSTVIDNIIKKCIDKDTRIYIFCSTVHKDVSWLATKKWLDENDIYYETHQSLKDTDGTDILKEIMNDLTLEDEDEEEKQPKMSAIKVDNDEDEDEKPRKKRKIVCENMFIFDDISSEIKTNKSVKSLLKQNRHTKSKVIISSQYVNDLPPESRLQMDYWLIFKGIKEDKLEIIYKDSDTNIDYEKFIELYEGRWQVTMESLTFVPYAKLQAAKVTVRNAQLDCKVNASNCSIIIPKTKRIKLFTKLLV